MATSSPTAILIVGMHRSGTSALAGLVGKLGVPLGDRLLAPGNDNPKGYWEHKDVVALHERLLNRLGSRWDDVRALPEGWLGSEAAQEASVAIDEIISRDFSGKPLWAVKDPRLCRVLPLWVEVLRKHHIQPVVLFMVRKPGEVSASIEARNHWHVLVGKLLWLRYMTEAATSSSTLPREIILYDDLLVDPISLVTKALAELGVQMGSGISEEERRIIVDFVNVADRHHISVSAEDADSGVDAIAEKLYHSLAVIAHGGNRWSSAEKIVLEFHREWRKNGSCVDAVADMAARIEQDLQSTKVTNFQLNSALTAQIRWSEEAQAKREALQAENAELSSKLSAQIRWSEEAQAKHEALQAETAELSSKLSAQIRWSEQTQAKHEALQAQLVDQVNKSRRLEFDLEMHQQRVRDASARLDKSEAEAAQASARHTAELHMASRERDRIAGELERSLAERLALVTEMESVYASVSWKMTKPLRFASGLLRNKSRPTNGSTRKP